MLQYKPQAQAIKEAITRARTILIVSHRNPDGDTIGAACAWISFLESKDKAVTAFCPDEPAVNLRYLPGCQKITTDRNVWRLPYDLIIVNDAASTDQAQLESLLPLLPQRPTIVNIDHHVTNPGYGDINLIVANSSSTTEIVSRLLLHWQEPITVAMANPLLHGLITDTSNFSNPGTTYTALEIAAELVRAGADMHQVGVQALKNRSIPDLKLWGMALARLRRHPEHNIIATYISKEDIDNCEATEDAVEGISNYLTLIPDAHAFLVLRPREDGTIKGSLRTIRDDVDVSYLASIMGGGGHRKAAGFTISGRLRVDGNHWTII